MTTVTIPKKEYQKLLEHALRYEYLRQLLGGNMFSPPPLKNVESVIKEFQKTGIYNQKFLASMKKGMRRSSYFRT